MCGLGQEHEVQATAAKNESSIKKSAVRISDQAQQDDGPGFHYFENKAWAYWDKKQKCEAI